MNLRRFVGQFTITRDSAHFIFLCVFLVIIDIMLYV